MLSFPSVEFYLLSQKNPPPSRHLHASELKDTQQSNMKDRLVKINAHFRFAAVWFVAFLLFGSTIFLCLQHKHVCVRSAFRYWLCRNLPAGTRGCREHKQFKKAITPRWHLQGTRGDPGTPSTSLITKGNAGPPLKNGERTVWGGEKRWWWGAATNYPGDS